MALQTPTTVGSFVVDNTSPTSIVSDAFTPAAWSLITVNVYIYDTATYTIADTTIEDTVTGWIPESSWGRYEVLHSPDPSSDYGGKIVFYRQAGPSPVEGTVTITPPSGMTAVSLQIVQFTSSDAAKIPNRFVGSIADATEAWTASPISATLSTAPGSANYSWMLIGSNRDMTADITAADSFTELYEASGGTGSQAGHYRTGSTSTAISAVYGSFSSSSQISLICVEIREEDRPVVDTTIPHRVYKVDQQAINRASLW